MEAHLWHKIPWVPDLRPIAVPTGCDRGCFGQSGATEGLIFSQEIAHTGHRTWEDEGSAEKQAPWLDQHVLR